MPLDVSRAPATTSPLWIIALFIALSEATAGGAAITTNGSARLIFAVFAVVFPAAVFGVFVWLVVKHAPKLYSPGQYSREVTPEIYRSGIIGLTRAESSLLARAVAETVVPPPDQEADQEARLAAVELTAQRFKRAVAESTVTVSLDRMKPGEEDLQIAVNGSTTVSQFLDTIWFALSRAVQPHSYGRDWILTDEHGKDLPPMGTVWANDRRMVSDERLISDVAIFPGTFLAAVPLTRK